MRAIGDEGTPVPIPNTVVKLVYGDNTWLATAREDNTARTQNTIHLGSVFLLHCRFADSYAVISSTFGVLSGRACGFEKG